jgi:signal transduction histidine kinase
MSLQESVQRVSRLQQGLLLLAKIDHQQFPSTAAVQLAQLVHRKLEEATDLVAAQQFQVSVALDSQARANLHPSLADILVRNLVSNALRHTPAQGRITIELNAGKFVVSNSGEPLSIDEERLFQPFAKARPEGPGLGLGLAIVRRIATSMGGDATYSYQEGMHHFTIHFPPA